MMTTTPALVQFLSTIVAAAGVCAFLRLLQLSVQMYRETTSKGRKPVQQSRTTYLPQHGPKGWPLIGSIVEHLRNWDRLHDWILEYFEKYHTVTAVMHCGLECYYTVDPENVKYILKTNFKNFPKGPMFHERMEILLGKGIFNSDGELWRQQRKAASVEFTMRSLRDFYAGAFAHSALKLSCVLDDIIRQGISIDMQDLFMRMTLDSIGKVGFGVEIGSLPWQLPLPENAFAKAFDFANNTVFWRFLDPSWKLKRFLRVGCEGELVRCMKVIDSFTYGVIAQRKLDLSNARAQQVEGVSQQAPKLDIMTRFLRLAEEEQNGIDYKMLRDIVLNFVIAGRDTTAVTLSWFIYSIMEKPDIAQRLYEELRNFEAKKGPQMSHSCTDKAGPNGTTTTAHDQADGKLRSFAKLLTFENLKPDELPYLQAALSETLRLFPAVPMDGKGIAEDDVLPDGTRVKAKKIIIYSPWGMGRMTSIWGPDAKEFKPERWLQTGKYLPESEFKFTAFQAGFRTCLGKDLAYTQMKVTAAILCRFYEFQLVKGHQVTYKTMTILSMANGLQVNIKRREDASPHIGWESEQCGLNSSTMSESAQA
ncbi:unnamed protein product [Calypogeia fissa]